MAGSLRAACKKEEAQLNGRKVVVVDTPGFDSGRSLDEYNAAEVTGDMKLCSPGPHVIVHVMDPLCSSQKEMKMAQMIQEMFGLKAKDYIILLVTHKNDLEGKSVAKFISSSDASRKKYFAECGNRCLAFNNKAKKAEREAQVAELMTMIDALVERNGDAPCYTEAMMKFK
ncbi:GTPase IMAP family member 7, partial [Ophiophagus hannah]